MSTVRELTPDDAEALTALYESVGFEYFDPEMEIPEGGTEELVRMTYQHE